MAASMASCMLELSVHFGHCFLLSRVRVCHVYPLRRVLSTLPNEAGAQPNERTNWFLDADVSSHRHHPGVRQMKPIRLPESLLSNIRAVLEGQTTRNLISDASTLSNYLQSRKRPVEDSELRAAARHYSQEAGVEDLDEDDLKSPSLGREKQRKLRHVMNKLRKSLYRWKSIEYDDAKSLSYLLSRMAPNYAVISRVLNEIKQQDPNFEPRSILDFGSGLGTTAWAAHSLWADAVKEYYLVDTSKSMHQLCERLLQVEAGNQQLHVPNVYHRYFMPVSLRSRYDVTVSAFSLLELPSLSDRISTVRTLWKITNDYMVLVENGSYESYLALMEARDAVLQESEHSEEVDQETTHEFQDRLEHQKENRVGHVFAPCPHNMTCPRLQDKGGTPCNFEQTYHPLVQYVGRHRQDIQTERFSYIILKKGRRDTGHKSEPWPRVVRPVLRRSHHVICRLCRHDGSLGEAVITKAKHSRDLYRCARYTNWGDLFPAAQTDRRTDHEDDYEEDEDNVDDDTQR